MIHSCIDATFSAVQEVLLRTASVVVPAGQRAEWREEWTAELWHVRQSCTETEPDPWNAHREVMSFCLGAFPDALCVRKLSARTEAPAAHVHGSAGQTLLWLGTGFFACAIIAHLLPGVQIERDADQFKIDGNTLLLEDAAWAGQGPSISAGLFQHWRATKQRFFDDLAFYRITRETASSGSAHVHWTVAHTTANLFGVLGIPVQYSMDAADAESGAAPVVLSHKIWQHDFASNTRVAGHVLQLGDKKVMIAGVAPATATTMPGEPDAWMLEPASQFAIAAHAKTRGYLIARLSERGKFERSGASIFVAAQGPNDSDIELSGSPLTVHTQGLWGIYEFAIFLALVALPAVTSVSLGDSSVSPHRSSMRQRIYRVVFLLAKFLLVAGIALYASLDLAYWNVVSYSSFAECLQLLFCFAFSLFGFRWAVADQRQRCPVCLRRVTHPAHVGLASRTFLGWNGTEMICMGGHTLLHVPSLPTSWFSGQRWLYLDSSWDFLFGDSYVC